MRNVIFLGLAIAGYIIPWVITPSSGLSVGAYDLAEFVSLTNLTTSLLLRIQLPILMFIVALGMPRPRFKAYWWMTILILLLMTIAQLPPFEFFTSERGDQNYLQQLILTGISLVALVVAFFSPHFRFQWVLQILLAVAAIVTSTLGLSQALDVFIQFSISTDVGVGIIVYIVAQVMVILMAGKTWLQEKRATSPEIALS